MKRLLLGLAAILLFPIAMVHGADSSSVPRFNKVMIIILENANYRDALAQPFLGTLTKSGALLSQFYAEAHPSLPNYIALTAGTTGGVTWKTIGYLCAQARAVSEFRERSKRCASLRQHC